MSKVIAAEELPGAYELAARHDAVVIAEEFISGTEVTASILGDTALPLICLETPRLFYDYEAKYLSNNTRYICPSGLDVALEKHIRALSLRAFQILGCRSWGRVDLMLDGNNQPFFLEVNTSPGMTDHSLVPIAARQAGLSFEDLVSRILQTARVGS